MKTHSTNVLTCPSSSFLFCLFDTGKDDSRKRKGSSPLPTDKSQSAKKKTPEEKKVTGFDRGLEPEKILGTLNR